MDQRYEERLALEQGPVLEYLLGADAHPGEDGHDDGHEDVGYKVLVVHYRVAADGGIAGEHGDDEGQQWCLGQCDGQVLGVWQLGAQVPLQEDEHLSEAGRPPLLRDGNGPFFYRGVRPCILEVHSVPFLGGCLSFVRDLAAVVQ